MAPRRVPFFTKADSCHRLVGVATRLLLLIRRELMQKPVAHGRLGDPSLSTSGETLTIEESMTLRARTENAGHGDEHEWSWGSG